MKFLLPLLLLGSLVSYCHSQSVLTIINTRQYELVLVDILNGTSQYELVSMDRNIKLGFDFIFLIVCSVLMIFFILTKNNISLLMVLPVYSATILYMVL